LPCFSVENRRFSTKSDTDFLEKRVLKSPKNGQKSRKTRFYKAKNEANTIRCTFCTLFENLEKVEKHENSECCRVDQISIGKVTRKVTRSMEGYSTAIHF
jgi:uncharacterized paraquat-inducible protein A